MSRVDQHLQHSVMGMLGSFWSRAVTEKTKGEARAITKLSANASDLRRLDTPMQKLVSEPRALVERVRVTFLDGDFVVVGPDMVNAWRSTLGLADGTSIQIIRRNLTSPTPKSQVLMGYNGRPLGSNLGSLLSVHAAEEGMTGSETLYVLPLPVGLTPITVATKFSDRVLVQGIDFETGPGYMTMRESPGSVFSAGGFTVLTGYQDLRKPYDFTMQVNGPSHGCAFIAAYYRGSISLSSFERAAAQAAGLLVLERDDTLVAAQVLTATVTRYTFLYTGVVDINYPHSALVVGMDYQRGHIVSNGFRIVNGTAAGWLRNTADGRTLRMDGVLSHRGLYLPPGLAIAYYAETGTFGRPHARVHLAGSEQALLAYWIMQRDHEKTHGAYLSDVIGLSAETPRVAFDMHAMLETFYGRRLLLVMPEMAGAPAAYGFRLAEFIARENPMGSAVLVAEEPIGVDPPGTFEPTGALPGLYGYGPGADGELQEGVLVHGNEPLSYLNELLAHQGDG